MKVDLLTLHCIKNYGSVLQTYATEQLLGDYFDEVETINFIRSDTADETLMDEWTRNDHGVKKMIKRVALTPMCNRYKAVFNSFLQKYVHTTEQKYYCDEDFKKYPITADAYCIGSDQVWNSSWNQGFLPAMFLAFAPDNAMKFAFCSSFGKTKLSEEEKKQASPLLDRLEYISVRESTALPVLESMGIKNGIHLLDPTLLLPSAFWDRIAAKRLVDHDYILVYQLNDGEKFDNYAKELCDETRYELPEDIRDREYFTTWLDYLVDGMWGFSDEYSVCEHCNKAFRTSPDSYSWVANYWVGDGFILCEDCVREDYSEEYLESLENNPKTANTILSDNEIEKAGYKKVVSDCESGWYGRCDNPEKMLESQKQIEQCNSNINVAEAKIQNNKDGRYLFSISGTGQFHTNFDMWEKIA